MPNVPAWDSAAELFLFFLSACVSVCSGPRTRTQKVWLFWCSVFRPVGAAHILRSLCFQLAAALPGSLSRNRHLTINGVVHWRTF